jgi:translocation and assembly module TamA
MLPAQSTIIAPVQFSLFRITRRTRLARLRCWLAFAATLVVASASGAAGDAEQLRYKVVIDAPAALRKVIEGSIDVVRWQTYEDMTADLLDRLIRESIEQAKEAAATEGFFSASIEITLLPAPAGSDEPLTLRLAVDPGLPTHIVGTDVRVIGPATSDVPAGTTAVASAQSEWRLPVGAIFRQPAWDDAKRGALATLTASPYAAARVDSSAARIDPEKQAAELEFVIDSGPRFHFGGLEVSGLDRYPPSLVHNFSTLERGETYSEERLTQFIRRLNASGYFASVHASIDSDPAQAHDATVTVRVIEALPRRIEGGIGFSTDTDLRGNFRYADVNVDGKAMQFSVDGRADTKIQEIALQLFRPPSDRGHLDGFEVKFHRSDIEGLRTQTASVGVARRTLDERDQTGWHAVYYVDDQFPDGAPSERSRALDLEYQRTWRKVDTLVAPTRGFVIASRVGGGPPGVSTRGYGRAIVQYASWHPVDRDSTINLRAEAGGVFATSRTGIPSALLFRTGGDTTVRGYDFESLGVKSGDATLGGRYYAIASAEAIRYFTPLLGIAAFVDAGNAGDDLSSLSPALGYGAGLRIRSPIGPLRLDVAYGQEMQQVRLHMSIGLAF